MTRYTLTILDTSGIQHYLFGTNNLKQNAGASYLADCATRDWVQVVLDQVALGAHNVIDFSHIDNPFSEERTIDKDDIAAEVIYAGGGNTAILFKEFEKAKAFATTLSRKVLVEAPGLKLLIAHQCFEWFGDSLGGDSGVVQSVMTKLQQMKQDQPSVQPLHGLGVTVDGVFTYRPAVGYDTQDRPVSAESWAKQQMATAAEKRLRKFLNESIASKAYSIPRDFEDIGGSHEDSSYIAVVHADGNRMGERVKAIQKKYAAPAQNPDYVTAIRAFSLSLQKAAHTALNETVKYLMHHIKPSKDADKQQHLIYKIDDTIELKNDTGNGGSPYLPFRPIVFGGDDVTFVCEGRLGLQMAAYYLEQFTKITLSDGEKAYCRAGVAVTHSHYPFALAYELAEKLCASAKSAIMVWQNYPRHKEEGVTAIDWHFAVNGMNDGLQETRQRDYIGAPGSLLMRPLWIDKSDLIRANWRSWEQFDRIIHTFQSDWLEQRNKLIGLRDPLRRGPDAVTQYRQFYSLDPLPTIERQRNMATTGWQGAECGYFDAIEALDFYGALSKRDTQLEKGEDA